MSYPSSQVFPLPIVANSTTIGANGCVRSVCGDLVVKPWKWMYDTWPGKPLHSCGKSPCWMGKSFTQMTIFNGYVTCYQKVMSVVKKVVIWFCKLNDTWISSQTEKPQPISMHAKQFWLPSMVVGHNEHDQCFYLGISMTMSFWVFLDISTGKYPIYLI